MRYERRCSVAIIVATVVTALSALPVSPVAIALGFAVFDLGDGNGQQLPLSQQRADMFDGVAFENAGLFAARGIESGEFESAHG